MNKEKYTDIRNKNNYTLQEIHLIQRMLPKIFGTLDKYYNIISVINNNTPILYITNNYTTQE